MFAATKLKLFKLSFNNCAPKLPYTLTQLTQPNPTNVNICLCVCACISLWSLLPLLLLLLCGRCPKTFALFSQR